jgi:hypothetical protein
MAKALNKFFSSSNELLNHSRKFSREANIPNSLSHHHPGGIYAVSNPSKIDLDSSFRDFIR